MNFLPALDQIAELQTIPYLKSFVDFVSNGHPLSLQQSMTR